MPVWLELELTHLQFIAGRSCLIESIVTVGRDCISLFPLRNCILKKDAYSFSSMRSVLIQQTYKIFNTQKNLTWCEFTHSSIIIYTDATAKHTLLLQHLRIFNNANTYFTISVLNLVAPPRTPGKRPAPTL